MEAIHDVKVKLNKNKRLLVVGAGLHGLVTAKVLSRSSNTPFSCLTIYEKGSQLGGVWASDRIYEGLTTNSPLLTYEIPGFPYEDHLRVVGAHASAQNVNAYLHSYADAFALRDRIHYHTLVEDVSWDPMDSAWVVSGTSNGEKFRQSFGYVVICVGLYHTSLNPLKKHMMSRYAGDIFHSSDVGEAHVREKLATSKRVTVIGAGKSALDLATILAKGQWTPNGGSAPTVSLIYRKPHWLSPRKIVRGTVAFEKVLFSRFVNAFLPYAKAPDVFHRWIADTRFGKWQTKQIFKLVADDFIGSNNQRDLPLTIPQHSLQLALSGALHVEPPEYLDCVRSGSIQIIQGDIVDMRGKNLQVERSNNGGEVSIETDTVLLATGYKLALPFFSDQTCQTLGILKLQDALVDKSDLPYLRLYRLTVPPGAVARVGGVDEKPGKLLPPNPCRNIAFNGYAYSLMNPTIAHVTAHWIADYFSDRIALPPTREAVEKDIDEYHAWQTASFGAHGAKGVHIGPHAILYTDTLLADMGLRSGHLDNISIWRPINFLREWFRPMYPEIYARVEADLLTRTKSEAAAAISSSKQQGAEDFPAPVMEQRGDGTRRLCKYFLYFVLICGFVGLMMRFYQAALVVIDV